MQEFENEKYEDEISLTDLLKSLWNGRFLIIGITLLFLILTVVGSFFYQDTQGSVRTIVSTQWSGVTSGEYPNGDAFIYSDMFESYVYSDALEEMTSDVTVNQLRQATSIRPITPISVQEAITQAIENGEQFIFYPTEFVISLDHTRLNISENDAQNVLTALVDGFREDFETKYIQDIVIVDYTDTNYTLYDYIEVLEILSAQLDLIQDAVNSTLPESADFVSSTSSLTFTNILARTNLIEDTLLNNLDARINNYLLSKDKDFQITFLNRSIDVLQLELDKALDYETEVLTALNSYTGGETVIVIPGLENTEELNLTPFLNKLYEELLTTQEQIASLENDIAYFERNIRRVLGEDENYFVTDEVYNTQITQTETLIDTIDLELEGLLDDASELMTEYNTFLNRGSIDTLSPPLYYNDFNLLLIVAIGTVLGGMISLAVLFIQVSFKPKAN